jgi:enterochelin esterase-like enzyme
VFTSVGRWLFFPLAVVLAGCVAPATPAPSATPVMLQTTPLRTDGLVDVWIMVTVPPNSGEVYLTGNLPELGPWKPDARRMGDLDNPAGTDRVVRLALPVGQTFEFKVTQGSWDREALGPAGIPMPNSRLQVTADTTATRLEVTGWKRDPREMMADVAGSGVKGTLIYWQDVASARLSETRHVSVWLPPGYAESPFRRYRVIYMSDGQNLFDPRIANTGIDWGMDEAMVAGVEAGRFEPAIIVGIWSSSRRMSEYSPWHEGPAYARFLIDELMPRVNREFRTLTGPENTFHMGSSMGGLISFYLVRDYPETFSACGCISTTLPWSPAWAAALGMDGNRNDRQPYVESDFERGISVWPRQRLFFSYGLQGDEATLAPSQAVMAANLARQGVVEGRNFKIKAYADGSHNEASWRAQVGEQLDFLLGSR